LNPAQESLGPLDQFKMAITAGFFGDNMQMRAISCQLSAARKFTQHISLTTSGIEIPGNKIGRAYGTFVRQE